MSRYRARAAATASNVSCSEDRAGTREQAEWSCYKVMSICLASGLWLGRSGGGLRLAIGMYVEYRCGAIEDGIDGQSVGR